MLYNLKTSIHPPIVYSRLQNFSGTPYPYGGIPPEHPILLRQITGCLG